MKCPNCKKEISEVKVYSECRQTGYLIDDVVKDYSEVECVLETLDIECPECAFSLKGKVKG